MVHLAGEREVGQPNPDLHALARVVACVELVERLDEVLLVERDDAPPESLGVELAHAEERVREAAEAHGGSAQGQSRTAHRKGFHPRGVGAQRGDGAAVRNDGVAAHQVLADDPLSVDDHGGVGAQAGRSR